MTAHTLPQCQHEWDVDLWQINSVSLSRINTERSRTLVRNGLLHCRENQAMTAIVKLCLDKGF